ncbi:MAG: oligopeptide transporter, OPT family [Verrucomicrobiales bacterium]|nr:oligopeptide transporter, OPT family [Verrucomicrobiales bacterium]
MAAETPASFRPYIPDRSHLREFTARSVLVGTLLGMVFGASSLYLTLKVGLTVSASIPVAVISIALFKIASKFGVRDATILEHNIAQTAGSAGESIAFGVGVTMPAILILGFDLEISRVMLVAALGGLLGILMMIPLRRALIVQQHGELKYPEGTACAEVLKAGAGEESRSAADPAYAKSSAHRIDARTIFTGFAVGLLYKTANVALKLWKDVPEKVFGAPLKGGSISAEISPEMIGVGYIIGPRIAGIMAAGGVLSYLVLIPMIQFFGQNLGEVLPPGRRLISEMSPNEVRGAYILYLGAGAVAAGGIISLLRSVPTIWHGIKLGLLDLTSARRGDAGTGRTARDLPLKFVGIGIVVLLTAITFAPPLQMNLFGAVLIVLLGFLFVTVSSRLTGEIGSSSNPVSGMTIATLLFTCLAFLAVGWTGKGYYVTALSVGAIVCIACSNGGTTSQDLKTGYLVGGTPRFQQVAILIGAFASALVLGPILLGLNRSAITYVDAMEVAPSLRVPVEQLRGLPREHLTGPQAKNDQQEYFVWHDTTATGSRKFLVDPAGKPVWLVDPGINGSFAQRPDGSAVRKFDAPKAVLVSYIIKGILDRRLPWELVILGAMIALTLELAGINSLAFAVGVYLPVSVSLGIFAGGAIRWLVEHQDRAKHVNAGLTAEEMAAENDRSPGVLMASGYIAGGSIAGIVIAFMAGFFENADRAITQWAEKSNPFLAGPYANLLSLLPFAAILILLWLAARGRILSAAPKA